LKFNSKLYQNAKLSCSRTKSEAFVTNVLGKKSPREVVINSVKQHKLLFFGLQNDASNHKNIFNILLRNLAQYIV